MKNCLGLIILLLFIFSACATHFHLDFLGKSKIQEVVLMESPQKEKLLVVDLTGTIQSIKSPGLLNREGDPVSSIYYRLKRASEDPLVKGIILRLDTPGGEATASDIIYHEILMFKEKTGIPVVALMMGVAASGGYYVASACDYIIAHNNRVGSQTNINSNCSCSICMNSIST